MPRYMPQNVFESLAILRVMADLAGDDGAYEKAVQQYRAAYPDEDFTDLDADISVAAVEVRNVSKSILKVIPFFDANEKQSAHFSILNELRKIVSELARKHKPLWRKIFGGTMSNYADEPLIGRIEKCRENVSKAGMQILALGLDRTLT